MNSFLHCREHHSLPQRHIGRPLDFLHSGGCSFLLGLGSILQGGGEGLVLFRRHGAEEILLFGGGSFDLRLRFRFDLRNGRCGGLSLEFHLGPVGGLVQGTQDTVVNAVENGLLVEEFHLGLSRMHIHIQGVGR